MAQLYLGSPSLSSHGWALLLASVSHPGMILPPGVYGNSRGVLIVTIMGEEREGMLLASCG